MQVNQLTICETGLLIAPEFASLSSHLPLEKLPFFCASFPTSLGDPENGEP